MINFRFHLVSLVAVFLALTVGIVVGASVVNRAIVDDLNKRIDRVGKNADDQRTTNRLIKTENAQLKAYIADTAPYIVEGRLTSVPVVVVAEQGIDSDSVSGMVKLMQDAGAQSPAIVWLQPKWLLTKPADRTALATIVGDSPTSPKLRTDGLDALADRLGTPVATTTSTSGTTTTTSKSGSDDVLDEMTKAGFVSIDPVGASGTSDLSTFPASSPRAVVLGGPTSDLAARPVVEPLTAAFNEREVPSVAGEVYHVSDTSPARGSTLAPVLKNPQLSDSVSTVDDVELVQGQVAAVLATADAGEARFGHYGYGKGADQVVPPWPGP